MEWIPKLLDNFDSTAYALYQSWRGYYRWILLRLAMSIMAVSALMYSPLIRSLAIGIVMTYAAMEAIDWSVSRYRRSRVVRTQN